MQPAYLSQRFRFERTLFAIENGEFNVTTRSSGFRRVFRSALADLDPMFQRKRGRFVDEALRGFTVSGILFAILHTVASRLRFVDDYLEFPVFRAFIYYLGAIIIVPMVFLSALNLFAFRFIEIRSKDGKVFARIVDQRAQSEPIEEFLLKLSQAIHREAAKANPSSGIR